MFRVKLNAALITSELRRSPEYRKSAAGRKPWFEVLIFKVLGLHALCTVSDKAMEYQVRNCRLLCSRRATARRARTLHALSRTEAEGCRARFKGAVETLFDLFDDYLKAKC